MAADAILDILRNVSAGLVVHKNVIRARVMAELPFMATENILMEAVKRGGDRQKLHERIRVHSQAAAAEVKDKGRPNDLLERIAADANFGLTESEIAGLLDPGLYTGLSARQVEEFVDAQVKPVLRGLSAAKPVELKV